jgi:3-phenylpropionate/trans-cinnamate dioxygenase ferredoxin subunit
MLICEEANQMSSLVEVSKTSELKDGTMEDMSVDGHEVLLARVGDKYYAADNRCPHMGGKLSRGKLEGTVVTCPLHGSQFDLRDGQVVRWLKKSGFISTVSKAIKPPKPLATYSVKVEGDRILIEI